MACAVVALRALPALAGDTFRYDRFSRDAAVALKQACLWADSSKLAVALHAARDAGVVGSEVIRGESSLNATVELRCAFSSRALQTAQEAGKPTLTLSLAGLLALKRRDSADSNDVNRITAALTRWKGLGEGQLTRACCVERSSLCAHMAFRSLRRLLSTHAAWLSHGAGRIGISRRAQEKRPRLTGHGTPGAVGRPQVGYWPLPTRWDRTGTSRRAY